MSITVRHFLRAWLLWWLLCSWAMADNLPTTIAVIVPGNSAQGALELTELAAIFRRTEIIDQFGRPLVPVNLPGDHPLRMAFSLALFKSDPADMEGYWNERYFHGVTPPHVVASIEAMLRFVAATEGAVGYIPLCAVDDRVKVVARLVVHGAPRQAFECEATSLPKLQTELAH